MDTTTTETPTVKPTIKLAYFNGAFSKFQSSAYGELVRAGLSKQAAHKVANDFGSNIGDAMKNADSNKGIATSVGKAKKEGESRIKISGSGMTTTSYAMSLIRVVQTVDGLFEEGLLDTREVAISSLSDNLQHYVANCNRWADEQNWE